ncbi:MAG: VOC family protein [Halioglobus sp.]|nr:VOC family protein [Halioglobus sp.]
MISTLFGPVIQIAYLVEDLSAGVQRWIERGVGPWTCFHNVVLDGLYRGAATRVTIDVGLSYIGDQQIELIALRAGAVSPYQDEDGRPLLGIHHLAWLADDLDRAESEALERGLTVAFRAENAAVRVVYLESPDEPGVLFEFIEGTGQRELIQQGIAAVRDWDGCNPVHVIDFDD